MDSRKQFVEWFLKEYGGPVQDMDEELFYAWQAGRSSMRDEAAKKCIATEFKTQDSPEWDAACQECHSEIMQIQP